MLLLSYPGRIAAVAERRAGDYNAPFSIYHPSIQLRLACAFIHAISVVAVRCPFCERLLYHCGDSFVADACLRGAAISFLGRRCTHVKSVLSICLAVSGMV